MVLENAAASDLSVRAMNPGSGSRRAAQFVGRVGALAVALGVAVCADATFSRTNAYLREMG